MKVALKSLSVSVTKVLVERLARESFKSGRKGCFKVEGSFMEEACVEVEGADGGLLAR